MTNLEYYKVDNLQIKEYDGLNVTDDLVVFEVSYVPKHSKELIKLFSKLCYKHELSAEKARFLLSEAKTIFDIDSSLSPINDDTLYIPKHIKKQAKKQYCFEG